MPAYREIAWMQLQGEGKEPPPLIASGVAVNGAVCFMPGAPSDGNSWTIRPETVGDMIDAWLWPDNGPDGAPWASTLMLPHVFRGNGLATDARRELEALEGDGDQVTNVHLAFEPRPVAGDAPAFWVQVTRMRIASAWRDGDTGPFQVLIVREQDQEVEGEAEPSRLLWGDGGALLWGDGGALLWEAPETVDLRRSQWVMQTLPASSLARLRKVPLSHFNVTVTRSGTPETSILPMVPEIEEAPIWIAPVAASGAFVGLAITEDGDELDARAVRSLTVRADWRRELEDFDTRIRYGTDGAGDPVTWRIAGTSRPDRRTVELELEAVTD